MEGYEPLKITRQRLEEIEDAIRHHENELTKLRIELTRAYRDRIFIQEANSITLRKIEERANESNGM